MSTPQEITLTNILYNIQRIRDKLAVTAGALTKIVFSEEDTLSDMNLENARASIGLEFQSLVQNIRAMKPTYPIIKTHPDIRYNIDQLIARRNWLSHEYGTTAPVRWSEIADSVFGDVPRIEKAVISALGELGVPVPFMDLEQGGEDVGGCVEVVTEVV